MSVTAIHTEITNDDGSLAGHVTIVNNKGVFTVRTVIPSENLDITQTLPYASYATARYATMVQKIRGIALHYESINEIIRVEQ